MIRAPLFICYNLRMLAKNKQLLTDRLVLKSIEQKDKKDFMEIVKDPLVKKTYMLPDFANEKEEDIFFKKIRDYTLDSEKFVYGIYSKNKIIGFLNEVTRENDEAEIGYFITPNEWNKGYATEALNVIIKELFRAGFKSVLCGHFEENAASRRVMQKCGMTKAEKEETVTYRNKEHHCFYYRIKQ